MIHEKAAKLFENWDEALIWSCLQGCMGTLTADDETSPESAFIDIGDFCFFAGKPNRNLLHSVKGGKLLIPRDKDWETLIEHHFGTRVRKRLRYAIKKEPGVFDPHKLNVYIQTLDDSYELRPFDREIFEMARSEAWSFDLCSQFESYEDYQERAVGTAILHQGRLVSGASPYALFHNGIEIEIDTKPEYRGRGLATVCGAGLILACLAKGLYPSWDAHDLRSVHLAEKLGYHRSHPYVTYELV